MDPLSFPLLLDQNLFSLHIWLLVQAVAEDFYRVDAKSIFSPQLHFQKSWFKSRVVILMLNYPHGAQIVAAFPFPCLNILLSIASLCLRERWKAKRQ